MFLLYPEIPVTSRYKRYTSYRYNERKLINVTVVRRVRPRAIGACRFEGHRRRKRAGRVLVLNGTSVVTLAGAEDAHARVPYPRALR